eukprot:Plantae.Rhodophyta-Rhodochaete_pulchella.ctg1785.p1 GENE.Plantae.Rhodophyta-Rhodochaete_pulchella.ctg1785~~Plantae.Rhodophyta-Rhodochaete_pulchella.ctg1785.p1  ORF type:complete len:517 (+),score=72.03 Plantae.Rhodophyta-Rhodochaete_pulchella.ctg1785:1461-3011(+)
MGLFVQIFGCRTSDDWLYQDEIEELKRAKAISHVRTAFSREAGQPKTYVQDIIEREIGLIREVLCEPDSHLFVCGDNGVASSVSAALTKVLGRPLVEEMVNGGRWHEEVFGVVAKANETLAVASKAAEKATIFSMMSGPIRTSNWLEFRRQLDKLSPNDITTARDRSGNSLLHLAARHGFDFGVFELLYRGIEPNLVNKSGITSTAEAQRYDKPETKRLLESLGGRVCSAMHENFCPLHRSVLYGDIDRLKELLDDGSNVDHFDFAGNTPLHLCAIMGRPGCAELLLKRSADHAAIDPTGKTPLAVAMTMEGEKHERVIQLLKEYGASLVLSNDGNVTRPAMVIIDHNNDEKAEAAGISQEDISLVQASFKFMEGEHLPTQVKERLERSGLKMFASLFEMAPHLLEMFPFRNPDGTPEMKALKEHGLTVMRAVETVVNRLNSLDEMIGYTHEVAVRHVAYGVQSEHYPVLGVALMATIEDAVGPKRWNKRLAEAWTNVFSTMVSIAIEAANTSEGA